MRAGHVGKHMAPRGGLWPRYRLPLVIGSAVVVVGGAGGAIAFAATRTTPAERRAHAEAVARARTAAEQAAFLSAEGRLLQALEISPAPGATGVALDSPVMVSPGPAVISSVKVAAASGPSLSGAISPATGAWHSTGGLLPSTTYTVSVTLAGYGVTATKTATFTTLTPVATVSANVYPTDGMTVGVGQPLVVHFDHAVSNPAAQKAVESRLTVAMSSPVPGAWYWFSDYEMHFRPQNFWPAGETVQVSGNLNGVDVGGGEWTAGSVLDTFSVGDARISYANLASEEMTVTLNGHTLYSYPISGGRPQYPTMDGVHIILDRESVVHMVSSTVGIPVKSPNGYDEYVYDDVHISDSGEYVHAAPWSVASQGVTNVSHGCINLSPTNAQGFFDFSRVGDVVEVTGSPRPAVWGDHGVMDWSGPAWSEWSPATIVALAPATPPTTAATTTTVAPAAVANYQARPTAPVPTVTVGPTTSTSRPRPTTTTPTTART